MGSFRLAVGLHDNPASGVSGDIDAQTANGPGKRYAGIETAIEKLVDDLFKAVLGVFGGRIADFDLST
jgi:hypothetical protein